MPVLMVAGKAWQVTDLPVDKINLFFQNMLPHTLSVLSIIRKSNVAIVEAQNLSE